MNKYELQTVASVLRGEIARLKALAERIEYQLALEGDGNAGGSPSILPIEGNGQIASEEDDEGGKEEGG